MKATDRFSVSATKFSDQLRKSGKQSGKAERSVMFYEVALKTRRRRKKHKEKNHKNLLRFLRSRSGQAGPESGHKSWQRFAQTDLQIAGEKCRENKKQINSEHRERSRKNTERAKKKNTGKNQQYKKARVSRKHKDLRNNLHFFFIQSSQEQPEQSRDVARGWASSQKIGLKIT